MKKLNIALLGLGTVGSGVVKIIEENRQYLILIMLYLIFSFYVPPFVL
ncbi:hypothetical protein, partial [Staphylococcus aureus]